MLNSSIAAFILFYFTCAAGLTKPNPFIGSVGTIGAKVSDLRTLFCCCTDPDTDIETALMVNMETVNDHRRQLTELLQITQAQNAQLRQFVSCPPATDDVPASTIDVSAPMSSIGELCYISIILTVSLLAYFCTCRPMCLYFTR